MGGFVFIMGWFVYFMQFGVFLLDFLQVVGVYVGCYGGIFMVCVGFVIWGFDFDLFVVSEFMLILVGFVVFVELLMMFCGIGYICLYEIDWIVVFICNICVFGGDVEEFFDGFCVILCLLCGGIWVVYYDYWMVMIGVFIGLCVFGVEIDDIGIIVKIFLEFMMFWEWML